MAPPALDQTAAMAIATQWYDKEGPYAGRYAMKAKRAFENAPGQWSIDFRVHPDPGIRYFRRFHFEPSEDGTHWRVTKWTEDPKRPESVDYEPDDEDMADEEATIEEEEGNGGHGDHAEELRELREDNELSIEELRAKYATAPPEGMDGEDDDMESDDAEDDEERPALPAPQPELRPPPSIAAATPLTPAVAMHLAAHWYNTAGPYGHLYKMAPLSASPVTTDGDEVTWSVRFRVASDTGFVYVRLFTFSSDGKGGTWEAVGWAEDAAQPDRVCTLEDLTEEEPRANRRDAAMEDGGDEDEGDDDETIEEEERTMRSTRESSANELKELQEDNCLSLDELRAKYGLPSQEGEEQSGDPEVAAMANDVQAANDDAAALAADKRRQRRKLRARRRAGDAEPDRKRVKTNAGHGHGDSNGRGHAHHGIPVAEAATAAAAALSAAAVPDVTFAAASPARRSLLHLKPVGEERAAKAVVAAAMEAAEEQWGATAAMPDVKGHAHAVEKEMGQGDEEEGEEEEEEDMEWAPDPSDPFSRYMADAEAEAHETEIYAPTGEHKESRVGPEYQAEVPAITDDCIAHRFLNSECCWTPHNNLSSASLEAYEREVRGTDKRSDQRYEHALYTLHRCDYDVDKAKIHLTREPHKPQLAWSDEDRELFESGLVAYGKAFHKIRRELLPNKSTGDVVCYYYNWKRTPHYDTWIGRSAGYEGIPRRKHLMEPGHDVREFANDASDDDSDSDMSSASSGFPPSSHATNLDITSAAGTTTTIAADGSVDHVDLNATLGHAAETLDTSSLAHASLGLVADDFKGLVEASSMPMTGTSSVVAGSNDHHEDSDSDVDIDPC